MPYTYRNPDAGAGTTISLDEPRPDLVATGRWTLIADDLDAAAAAAVADLTARRAGEQRTAALVAQADTDRLDRTGGGTTGDLPGCVRVTPEEHGAARDGRVLADGAIIDGATTLTCASGEFTGSDVGKAVTVAGAGLNVNANTLSTTITAVNSATSVELATAAAVTVTGARVVYGTDDTEAIQAALDQAYADGVDDGSYHAQVVFSAGRYMVAGALTRGAPYYGNAQVCLPVNGEDANKFVLELIGAGDAATFGHWNQDEPQASGTVIHSTLIGASSDGTWGAPACIGGPTRADQGGGFAAGWSNMLLVVDGLIIVGPRDPGFVGLAAGRVAQLHVKSLGALADRTPGQMNVSAAQNDLGLGLQVPFVSNNHYVLIENYACEGWYYGCTLADHFTALRLVMVYCRVAWFVLLGGANEHGISILNAGVEACETVLQAVGSAGGRLPIWVGQLNTELGTGTTFIDTNDVLVGEINFTDNGAAAPTVSGCGNVRIVDLNRRPGAVAAPSVPATTVALRNPFFRDALVHVAGGTVTAIAVDGTATGVTAGSVLVPTGQTITLTYSVAPTWVWTLA